MRKTVLALALVGVLLTSGCLGLVGTGTLSFESTPATVSESVRSNTGYLNETVTDVSMNKSFEIRGKERTVTLTNWNAKYEKDSDGAKSGVFATFTTPKFGVAGTSLNPVGEMDTEQIIEYALSKQSGVAGLEKVGETNAVILGQNTTVTTYQTSVQSQGGAFASYDQSIRLHVSKVSHNGDYVIAIGIHPEPMEERENIIRLMESIEHADS